jgi:hypothetical protein
MPRNKRDPPAEGSSVRTGFTLCQGAYGPKVGRAEVYRSGYLLSYRAGRSTEGTASINKPRPRIRQLNRTSNIRKIGYFINERSREELKIEVSNNPGNARLYVVFLLHNFLGR